MTDEDTGSMPQALSLIAERGVTFKYSFVDLPFCAPAGPRPSRAEQRIITEPTAHSMRAAGKQGSKCAAVATRKYVRYDDGFEELYDLVVDPYEFDNKVKDPSYASDAATLRTLRDSLKSRAGPGC